MPSRAAITLLALLCALAAHTLALPVQHAPAAALYSRTGDLDRRTDECEAEISNACNSESFEAALKRFKKQCQKAGILSEVRRRCNYEKPSVKRKNSAAVQRKAKS